MRELLAAVHSDVDVEALLAARLDDGLLDADGSGDFDFEEVARALRSQALTPTLALALALAQALALALTPTLPRCGARAHVLAVEREPPVAAMAREVFAANRHALPDGVTLSVIEADSGALCPKHA